MSRSRYWKLTADEVEKLTHDPDKILNWEIKGIRKPEEEAKFIGIFTYRKGTPLDYEMKKGIVYYHNNIDRKEIPKITKFLEERYGGDKIEKGERIFLDGSKEIYTGKDIAELARALDERFDTTSVVSIELEDVTQEQLKEWGYPDAKLLPIPGK
uniref:Uncharacterized protein n=1 Tax=uncultured marine thaumarchaeote KM3_73_E02 TaxID=1456267 RepID=A0A075HIS7_9ARCH|nr:hypothetical protein [uncultured marine thaumarchaeote KM3_73_E02]